MTNVTPKPLWIAVFAFLVFAVRASGQAPPTFSQALGYQNKFAGLASENALRIKQRDELVKGHTELTRRLAQNDQFLMEIMGRSAFLQMGLTEASAVAENGLANFQVRDSDGNSRVAQARTEARQIASLQVQIDMVVQMLRTTNEAARLGIERRVKILNEMQTVATEYESLHGRLLTQFNSYWELADIDATHNVIELRAALRELEKASENDEGAQFALAITLLRLKQVDEASAILDKLVTIVPIRAVVRAAQCEVMVLKGQKKELKVLMREALSWGPQDVRVRIHRARALALAGELKEAEQEWEAVLKSGQHDVLARRSIALVLASMPTLTERQREKMIDHAKIAAQLAPGDWLALLAYAFVAEARKDNATAIQQAEAAADVATGSNKTYCLGVLETLKAGQDVTWDFKAFAMR